MLCTAQSWWLVPFRVSHAVRTWLWSCPWLCCTLFFVELFASRALSCCKHNMGALSWLNAETLERAPTPLFDRCCAHGHSFLRLRYTKYLGVNLFISVTVYFPTQEQKQLKCGRHTLSAKALAGKTLDMLEMALGQMRSTSTIGPSTAHMVRKNSEEPLSPGETVEMCMYKIYFLYYIV